MKHYHRLIIFHDDDGDPQECEYTLSVVEYQDRYGLSGEGPHAELIEPCDHSYMTEAEADEALQAMSADWESFAEALEEQ